MVAIIENRYEDTDERLIKFENDFVNLAIEHELKKFFKNKDDYKKLSVDIENPLTDYSPDYESAVDTVRCIIDLLPRYQGYEPFFEYPAPILMNGEEGNWEDFTDRKFLQLCKLVKANESYDPDLFQSYLLMELASLDCCKHTVPIKCDYKKEMMELLKAEIYKEYDVTDKDELQYAKDRYHLYELAFKNLYSLCKQDIEEELNIVTDNLDWTFVYERGLTGAIKALTNAQSPNYNKKSFYDMFESVGYQVPKAVKDLFQDETHTEEGKGRWLQNLTRKSIPECLVEDIDICLSSHDFVIIEQLDGMVNGIDTELVKDGDVSIMRFTSKSGKEYSSISAGLGMPPKLFAFPRSQEGIVREIYHSMSAKSALLDNTGKIGGFR